MRGKRLWGPVGALGLLLAGCFTDPQGVQDAMPPAPELQPGRVSIVDDPATLAQRITYRSRLLYVDSKDTPGQNVAPVNPGKARRTQLTLVGEVAAPDVDGVRVQANDIDIDGRIALVGYNVAGDERKGALQIIDFRNPRRPRVVAEVHYHHADVNAVAKQGSRIWVGLGSGDPALATPALVEGFTWQGERLEPLDAWHDLPSATVTDVAACGDHVVAAVGARDGGIAVLERRGTRLAVQAFVAEEDVRGIAVPSSDAVFAVCGTQPRMGAYGLQALDRAAMQPVDGYGNAEAKGTIEVHRNLCWLGAGDGGFQVRTADGTLVAQLPNRAYSNLRPDLAVTNAVSVHGSLAFVAAGAVGVQVVDVHDAARGELTVLGELAFEDGVSSNMVKAKEHLLVVAGGLGGVKLVKMDTDDDDDED